jgi:predicted metal-binding protein
MASKQIEYILHEKGDTDSKWIDPKKIIVARWVRKKCVFGCGEYGHGGACPPNTPPVAECERFFKEYTDAIILHLIQRANRLRSENGPVRFFNGSVSKFSKEGVQNTDEGVIRISLVQYNSAEDVARLVEGLKTA